MAVELQQRARPHCLPQMVAAIPTKDKRRSGHPLRSLKPKSVTIATTYLINSSLSFSLSASHISLQVIQLYSIARPTALRRRKYSGTRMPIPSIPRPRWASSTTAPSCGSPPFGTRTSESTLALHAMVRDKSPIRPVL